ncbi:MAG: efflux RND transporter periplasmic adaptor subunit [Phycisphaerales bacterium]|nr:efflux RND transporter periplasmic adaptor subunit [Phycisphaerales bacterium]
MNTTTRLLTGPLRAPAWIATLVAAAALTSCKPADSGAPDDPPVDAARGGGDEHGEHADEVTLTAEAIDAGGISVEAAGLRVLRPTFIAPARVSFNAESMAHVGSPLTGRATQINVRLGDTVTKGQPLVVIESPELGEAQADYLGKRTAAQTTAPAAELARLSWERARGLFEGSRGISLTEVQRRETEYAVALAAQRTAEAAAMGAENRLHLLGMTQAAVGALIASGEVAPHFTITAAIDGTVVEREITLGELVGPERESLLVLADTSTLWVLADVPEGRVPGLAPGATAWVSIGAGAEGSGGARSEGRVSYISPMVDPNTRTAQIRIELPAGGPALRPGMFARAEIVAAGAAEPAPVVAVPEGAVQTVEGGPAVFVPVDGEPGVFAKRPVSIGRAVGGLVPVLSGLAEGERFVSGGSFILKAELGKGSAEHTH